MVNGNEILEKIYKFMLKVLLVLCIIIAAIVLYMFIPILNDTNIANAYNKSYGQYNNLSLYNTHFDGINQKVVIKTEFEDIKDMDEPQLIDVSKEFMIKIQKYIIPKKVESVWIIFTNSEGHSIGSMWVDRDYVKKVIWKETTDDQFKNVMNFK